MVSTPRCHAPDRPAPHDRTATSLTVPTRASILGWARSSSQEPSRARASIWSPRPTRSTPGRTGRIPRDELLRRVAGADGIVALLSERIDEELLDAAGPQLRIVADVAVGYNNVDVDACTARNVVVTNTPGVLTEATADLTMALLLMASRRLSEGDRLVRSRQPWEFGMFLLLGTSLQGRQLGIVGMGAIGSAVARRARAFGMTVAYSNRRQADPSLTAAARRDPHGPPDAAGDERRRLAPLPLLPGDAPPDRTRAVRRDAVDLVPDQHLSGSGRRRGGARRRPE